MRTKVTIEFEAREDFDQKAFADTALPEFFRQWATDDPKATVPTAEYRPLRVIRTADPDEMLLARKLLSAAATSGLEELTVYFEANDGDAKVYLGAKDGAVFSKPLYDKVKDNAKEFASLMFQDYEREHGGQGHIEIDVKAKTLRATCSDNYLAEAERDPVELDLSQWEANLPVEEHEVDCECEECAPSTDML